MKFGNVTIDTNDMTYAEINALVQELRAVRARKEQLHERINTMRAMTENMREAQMSWVNKYTGEIFDPEDWDLFDETTNSVYYEEVRS